VLLLVVVSPADTVVLELPAASTPEELMVLLLPLIPVLLVATDPPLAAAWISSAVASGTSRFCVKIHPCSSLASSQVFPAAVGSLTSPGAKVPDFKAS
jgi:hypothetical protein